MRRKITIIILCVLLLCTTLSSCKSKEEKGPDGEGITIRIGLPTNTLTEDFETNAYTKWLEEETGYNLEFEYFAASASDLRSQLSTRIVNGETLPDILFNFNLGDDVYKEYGDDKYFIDLKQYFDDKEKSEVFWKRFELLDKELQDTVLRRCTDKENGAMYAFPHVETSLVDVIDYQAYINKDWLNKLNLKMPTNKEELKNVLTAFRDKDPNGNGKKDEIPLLGAEKLLSGDVINYLVNMFTYSDDSVWWNVDENNKLYMPYTTDKYRDALIYINDLVNEGLMSSMVWTITTAEMKSILAPETNEATIGMFIGHPTIVLEPDNMIIEQYEAVPYWGNVVKKENLFTRRTFITEDCKNPDAAWNLLMKMCSEEGSKRMRYGEYEKDWVESDKGTKSYLGLDTDIKVLNESAFASQGNQTWHIVEATILLNSENETAQLSDDMSEWTKYKLNMTAGCYNNFIEAREKQKVDLCPSIILSQKEKEETATERRDCQEYIKEARSAFGSGVKNPRSDSEWNAYIKQLESLGLEKWREQSQKIFEQQTKE